MPLTLTLTLTLTTLTLTALNLTALTLTLRDKLARWSGQKGHIGRITWRHDSIMFAIFRGVLRVVKRFKKAYQEKKLGCLLYTSPSPRDRTRSRMPSSA